MLQTEVYLYDCKLWSQTFIVQATGDIWPILTTKHYIGKTTDVFPLDGRTGLKGGFNIPCKMAETQLPLWDTQHNCIHYYNFGTMDIICPHTECCGAFLLRKCNPELSKNYKYLLIYFGADMNFLGLLD